MIKRLPPMLAFGIIIILAILIGGYVQFVKNDSNQDKLPGIENPRGCTMEAKLCSDGSAVGRSGPNCEFAECPTKVQDCDFIDLEKEYKYRSGDMCTKAFIVCEKGKKVFNDDCGCGCEIMD